jgi:hypothetical protein
VVLAEGHGSGGRRVDEGERPAAVGAEVGEDAGLADEGRAEDAGGSGTDEGDMVGASTQSESPEYEMARTAVRAIHPLL